EFTNSERVIFNATPWGLFFVPHIFYNPDTLSGLMVYWCPCICLKHMAVCGEDQAGNSYLMRGFGIFSHQIAVTITYSRGQTARRACIIIANIKSEFYFFVVPYSL